VVGRGEHLPQLRTGQRAVHGDVDVRGEPPLAPSSPAIHPGFPEDLCTMSRIRAAARVTDAATP
jgi:hypothetical protein